MGYSPGDHTESDMTERLTHTHTHTHRLSVSTTQGPGDVELTTDETDHHHIRVMIDGYMRYSPTEQKTKRRVAATWGEDQAES